MPYHLISIIDDDESLRLAIVSLVRSFGYQATGFASAEAFLADAPDGCDCIVTDIQMPGMSGIDLAKTLGTRGIATPVIMMTARTEPAALEAAQACRPHCLLKKPFSGEMLMECIEQAISR